MNPLIKSSLRYLVALLLYLNCAFSQAQIINFNFLNLTNASASDTITADDGSTTLTVSTTDDWGNIRQVGIRVDSDGLRVYRNSLSLTFSFSKDVIFKSFFNDYSYQADNHSITFTLGNESKNLEIRNNNGNTEEFPAAFNNWIIPANTPVTLNSVVHANVASSQFWSSLAVTVVPEPATYAFLLGCAVLGISFMIRRRAKNKD